MPIALHPQSMVGRTSALIDSICRLARRISGSPSEYRPIVGAFGDARLVLLGESTHGSHEFYRARTELTKLLIREHGFRAVAIEADWPDALRVNRYVRGESPHRLDSFVRFPSWMWRNEEVAELVDWLRVYNLAVRPAAPKVGLFGLDLYAAPAAIDIEDSYDHERGYAEPRSLAMTKRQIDAVIAPEDLFFLEQNARVRRNATRYFEAMQSGFSSSWNLRDRHMLDTLDALLAHLDEENQETTKVVVWAHNSHVGDARATQMGANGDLSLGQLVREKWGDQSVLVGLLTARGSVIASSSWGGHAEIKTVRPPHPESYEALLGSTKIPAFALSLAEPELEGLSEPRLERAIGALYLPDNEMENHYFSATITKQFDHVIFFEQTSALAPLDALSEERRCA